MRRRSGIICLAAMGPLLICGGGSLSGCASNPNSFQIGPTRGQVIGASIGLAAVAVGTTVILVEVHKAHHTLKGCVTGGPDALELTTRDDNKLYALSGATANLKAGDLVKVHGSKQKARKNSSGPRDFAVEKINRDYGACSAFPAPAPAQHIAR